MSEKYPEWWELPGRRWVRPNHYRDGRKQKLYDAENNIRHQFKIPTFGSIEEIDAYIRSLINDPWIRKRWKEVRDEDFLVTLVHKSSGAAEARRMDLKIWLPKWAWNTLTVLHEFTHLLVPSGFGPGHGRYFARSLLELVGHVLGKEVREALRREYVKFGVQYQPLKNYTPQTLEAMKAHGQKLIEHMPLHQLGREVQDALRK